MPTYDYQCKSCGYKFERFQHMIDAPLKICPECGKEVKRLIGGGVGIIFKGSGFYTTDYKRSSANTSTSSNKDNKDNNKNSSGNTSENKTTATTETKETKSEAPKEPVKA